MVAYRSEATLPEFDRRQSDLPLLLDRQLAVQAALEICIEHFD